MVSATIKFVIATEQLRDKKEDSALELKAGRSADGDKDLQSSSAEENHNI